MAMAGCQHCGWVVHIAGSTDARIGEVWKGCTECGEPMRWVEPIEAARLVGKQHELSVSRDPAGVGLGRSRV